MKKSLVALLVAGTFGITACGTGGGCETSPTINVNPINVPESFVPFGKIENTEGTTPVAYNQATGEIAYIVNNSYQQFTLPANVKAALSTAFTNGESANIAISSAGQSVAMVIPSAIIGNKPEVYVLTPTSAAQPNFVVLGGQKLLTGEALGTPVDKSSYVEVVSPSDTEYSTQLSSSKFSLQQITEVSTNVIPVVTTNTTNSTSLQSSSSQYYPLTGDTGCSGWETTKPTPSAVQVALYNGTYYIGAGSQGGQVCVMGVTGTVVTQPWQSLTYGPNTAEVTSRYTPGKVNQFSFYPGANELYGYWNVNSAGNNQIYRVTSKTSSINAPASFWNTTNPNKQTSTTFATSVQFSNVPAQVNSTFTDNNNNIYVGTLNGMVYKLASGSTQWISTKLANAGVVDVAPTAAGTGAVASVTVNGQVSVFNIQ